MEWIYLLFVIGLWRLHIFACLLLHNSDANSGSSREISSESDGSADADLEPASLRGAHGVSSYQRAKLTPPPLFNAAHSRAIAMDARCRFLPYRVVCGLDMSSLFASLPGGGSCCADLAKSDILSRL